jgi:hypothetical protein
LANKVKREEVKAAKDNLKAANVNNKAAQVEAAIEKADIIRQKKEAEKQHKIDAKKKKAQEALEAKEVTPNRILEELYDEIAIGPFNKSENYPFDKRGNDPFGSLYKLSMFGNKVFDALVSEPVPGDTEISASDQTPPEDVKNNVDAQAMVNDVVGALEKETAAIENAKARICDDYLKDVKPLGYIFTCASCGVRTPEVSKGDFVAVALSDMALLKFMVASFCHYCY